MILMTLGTIPYPFERAISWLAVLLEQGIITESVFVQYGASDISLLQKYPNVIAESTIERDRLLSLIDDARLVISHAGQGSTRLLAERGASFVLLPRLKVYAEHIDDHQLGFAQAVAESGVRLCQTLGDLEEAVRNPPPSFGKKLFEGPSLSEHLTEVYPT